MKNINLSNGKKIAAAGILGVLAVFGAYMTQAAEEKTAVSAGAGIAVDAKGAEEIAFADAAVTADEVGRLKTEAERENGEPVYEVSFAVDGIEYEYLIREADGLILEWEIDGRDIGEAAAEESLKDKTGEPEGAGTESDQDANTLIGLEKAKEIALSDAGSEAKDVSFSKLKFENDSRSVVYEVEFYQGKAEFEYTIDAYTGAVLKMERD